MKHVFQFSGGKDSTALVLWAKTHLDSFITVFCDTGWEHPLTYAYVEYINQTQLGGALVTVKSARYTGLVDLCASKKMSPNPRCRFCTEELKLKPFVTWLQSQAFEDDVTIYQGIRGGESHARSQMPRTVYDPLFEATIERPLFDWTTEQVFALHAQHGVEPNPLYKKGAARVGCFPCVMISLGELRRLSQTLPEVWDRIRSVEDALPPGRGFFITKIIPARFHTGAYSKPDQHAPGETVKGTFATWDDVRRYVTNPDQITFLEEPPTQCLSVYNLCE